MLIQGAQEPVLEGLNVGHEARHLGTRSGRGREVRGVAGRGAGGRHAPGMARGRAECSPGQMTVPCSPAPPPSNKTIKQKNHTE